jgi:hypothetical protein
MLPAALGMLRTRSCAAICKSSFKAFLLGSEIERQEERQKFERLKPPVFVTRRKNRLYLSPACIRNKSSDFTALTIRSNIVRFDRWS